jgi:hypothetical protein
LQHLGIASANTFFGYATYPTLFGSEYLEYPAYGSIVEYPSSQRDVTPELLNRSLDAVNTAVSRHEDVNWRFALVDRSRNSATNPAHDLIAQHADYKYYRSGFLDKLPAGCPYVDLSYEDVDSYFANYFHTDHHWQISGALDGYAKIMTSFGKTPLDGMVAAQAMDDPFYGSEARSGLTTEFSDTLMDIDRPAVQLSVTVDGKKKPMSWLNEGYSQDSADFHLEDTFANAYATWFHGDAGYIHIRNEAGEGSLLIVGDSFTNNIDYLFAYTYRDVHILDPRHYTGNIEGFLKKHPVDDALLLMGSNTLVNAKTVGFLAS